MQARTEGKSSEAWSAALLSQSKADIIWWYNMGEAKAKAELDRIYSGNICYNTEDLTSLIIIAYKDSILKDIKSGLDIFEAVINKANPSKRDILEDMFDPVHAVRCFGISRQKLDSTASTLCNTNKNLDPTEIWIKAATGLILETELAGVS